MRFTFVVPGLASLDRAALASSRSLARIASWASVRSESRGWRAALLSALGAPHTDTAHDLPAAPLAALGAGADPHGGFALAADPVALVAGREDVAIAGRVDDLGAADARALVAALDAHFADDGLAFEAPRPDAWFAFARRRPDLRTTPLDAALGSAMSGLLPKGGDARTWLRWATEIQMLLAAHPVNAERERRGLAPMNGLWFWGGGTLADVGLVAPFRAHAPDGAEGDFLRGLARHAGGESLALPSSFEAAIEAVPAARPATHVAAMLPPVADAHALAALDRAWLEPATRWLERGRIASLALVADEGSGAAATTWTARRPSMPARLRASVAPRRFAPARR
ncbi:MAG: hypothetical protein AMXMBFR42_13120 [Burkholderiales bacterium]